MPAKRYDCVTLLFSGIVGFSTYCASNADSSGAMEIVQMLNELYTAFDTLTEPRKNPNIYKVSNLIVIVKSYRRGKIMCKVESSELWHNDDLHIKRWFVASPHASYIHFNALN